MTGMTEERASAGVLAELDRRVDAGALELPLLPGVAMEVTSAAASETADARLIADILRRDQAMAAHVLRVVSSPVYSGRAQIVSLQQAVARLGAAKIREVSFAIAFRVGVFKLKGYEAEVAGLFRHAVAAALFAQEVARLTRRNVEEAFLCGLLHDVGRPVIMHGVLTIAAEQRAVLSKEAVLAAAGERHCHVGATLATTWQLPEPVRAAIRHHHDASPPAAHALTIWTTALGDELSRHAFEPERVSRAELEAHPALPALEIYPDMLERLLGKAESIKQLVGALA